MLNNIMKPNIDLNSPYVKIAINSAKKLVKTALNAEQTVEKTIIPIYYVPKGKRLTQVGSGVLLKIKNEYFILSDSHIFDHLGAYALLTGDGTDMIQSLEGDRFSTLRVHLELTMTIPLMHRSII